MIPGSADKSYGLHVARLAGIPAEVVERAEQVLANLEAKEYDPAGRPAPGRGRALRRGARPTSCRCSRPAEEVVAGVLREVDLERLTPLAALNLVAALRERLRQVKGGALLFVGVEGPRLDAAGAARCWRACGRRGRAGAAQPRGRRERCATLVAGAARRGARADPRARCRGRPGRPPARRGRRGAGCRRPRALLPPAFARRAGRLGRCRARCASASTSTSRRSSTSTMAGSATRSTGAVSARDPRAVVSRAGAFLDGLHAGRRRRLPQALSGPRSGAGRTPISRRRGSSSARVELARDLAPFAALARARATR